MSQYHIPVLKEKVLSFVPQNTQLFVDLTVGNGGHSYYILDKYPNLRLYAMDRDKQALDICQKRLEHHKDKITYLHTNFVDGIQQLHYQGIKADFVLADLGVCTMQLTEIERGFSFSHNSPLDMRMDQTQKLTAWDIVNTYPKERLRQIFFNFGEIKNANYIANKIISRRVKHTFETTLELSNFIAALCKPTRNNSIHPATRFFQAIRIEVNQELKQLELMLSKILNIIKKNGRVAIISFHSLEDRQVKKKFVEWTKSCLCPPDFPICVCNTKKQTILLTKKSIMPTLEEKNKNPKSRSAKLRVSERL